MKKINIFSLVLLFSSCSTLKKTLIYSAASGGVIGGFVGRELSPDKESDNFNTVIGAVSGALLSSAVSYYFYKDANPSLDLKKSPLKSKNPLDPLYDSSFSDDKMRIMPKINLEKDKEYLKLSSDNPEDLKKSAKKQYFKRYKTEAYMFEENGKTYDVPSFKIIESGFE